MGLMGALMGQCDPSPLAYGQLAKLHPWIAFHRRSWTGDRESPGIQPLQWLDLERRVGGCWLP